MATGEVTGALRAVGRASLGVEKRPYVRVFAALAASTAVEFQIPLPPISDILSKDLQIVFLVAFAIVKASMVVAYYMHLRYEPRVLAYIPLAPLILIAALVAVITYPL